MLHAGFKLYTGRFVSTVGLRRSCSNVGSLNHALQMFMFILLTLRSSAVEINLCVSSCLWTMGASELCAFWSLQQVVIFYCFHALQTSTPKASDYCQGIIDDGKGVIALFLPSCRSSLIRFDKNVILLLSCYALTPIKR